MSFNISHYNQTGKFQPNSYSYYCPLQEGFGNNQQQSQQNQEPGILYQCIESKQLPAIYISNQTQFPIFPQHSFQPPGLSIVNNNGHSEGYYSQQQQISSNSFNKIVLPVGYYAPTLPSASNILHQQFPHNYSPNEQSTTTISSPTPPQQPKQFRHEYQSIPNGRSTVKQHEDNQHNESVSPKPKEKDMPIDYSSLISYTVSPSLKKKRRSKQRIVESNQIYPCEKCDKVFQKPYNLKSHMRTHSNEKPFKCSVCSKTFARSHDKKRHELLHGGKKNFKCEGFLKDGVTKWGCGKKFARSDALSRHFRTETGWLCIKPLMDEAKKMENEEDHQQRQEDQQLAQHPPQSQSSKLNLIPTSNSYSDNSSSDNSNFIRKLSQRK